MDLVLKSLKAINFKGFRNFELEFSPKTTIISGDNETGKTTLYDAFCYCLTKKNSSGDTDFGIKPNFSSEIVSPSVEIECLIDSKPVSLKRTYQAKFTRDKKFSGYTTECFINGIPVGIKDFEAYVSKVANEEVFKLLTFPNYFTELITPSKGETAAQRQCKLLKGMANVEDDKSIALKKECYAPLVALLERYSSVDDIQRFYKSESKRIHGEIDDIPVKIEQQVKNLYTINQPESVVKQDIQTIGAKILELQKAKNDFSQKRLDEIKVCQDVITGIQTSISGIVTEYHIKADEVTQANRAEALKVEKECEELDKVWKKDLLAFNAITSDISTLTSQKKYIENELQSLSEEYSKLTESIANPKSITCPLCGQEISSEKVLIELKSKLEKTESLMKEQEVRIQEITGYIDTASGKKSELNLVLKKYSDQYESKKEAVESLRKEIDESNSKIMDEMNQKVESLNCEVMYKKAALSDLKNAYREEVKANDAKLDAEIVLLKADLKSREQMLFHYEQNRKCRKMIEELEAYRDECNEQLDKAQMYLDLSEQFIKERSSMLEEAVNKMFSRTRFKFSRENKSGKVLETCIPTFNGQDYKDLSASTKAICNIDIVNGFQRFYNCHLPVFIDNAEGITETLECGSQTVLLRVEKECCPNCGGETGRKQENEFWKCKNCGHEFKKQLKVSYNN